MSQAPMAPSAEPHMGEVLRIQAKPDWQSKIMNPKNLFIGVGVVLLGLLSIVPIWNAVILMQDSNYVYFAGTFTPKCIIAICVSIILGYALMVMLFFRRAGSGASAAHIEQNIMMVANISITVFGLFLMLASIPLTHQAEVTYSNLLYRCETSEQTHRLMEYSQVLQNMRATPACAKQFSVEDCAGYEEAAPYTTMLKGMENNFRCAGFCYQAPAAVSSKSSAPAPAPSPSGNAASPAASLLSVKKNMRQSQLSLATDSAATQEREPVPLPTYPPTLFSDMNFKASCDGMAARDMKNFAGDIGQSTFAQGLYFLIIAVCTGLMKLMSMCMRKN